MKNKKLLIGVKVKECKLYKDSRGFLTELIKQGEETFIQVKQTIFSKVNPGIIKAFHFHKKQTDVWFVASGKIKAVLHDMRKNSLTYKKKNIFIMGEDNPILLLIPPGIAHGYQVLGKKPALIFYCLNQRYNSTKLDEGRIPYDDPDIAFDWGKNLK